MHIESGANTAITLYNYICSACAHAMSFTLLHHLSLPIVFTSAHLRQNFESKSNDANQYEPTIYSFAPAFFLDALSLSLNRRLKIFPLGLLGMTSINSTPPLNHLCRAFSFSMNLMMSCCICSSDWSEE